MEQLRGPLVASFFLLISLSIYALHTARPDPAGLLTVAFLDVGQGDAIFIESPTGVQVLIDGGRDNSVLAELDRMMDLFDRDLDMVVATHADADHIGGLIDVLERYAVDTVVMTQHQSDSPAFAAFMRTVEAEGATVIHARAGQIYDLGDGAMGSTTLSILFPDHDPTGLESNTASVVSRLAYGTSAYLLTGDAPASIEAYLTTRDGNVLESDVLKLGHHGSDTSTSNDFLDAVRPRFGVISAGRDNPYGHPHAAVRARLDAHGIPYENTAEEGSIVSVTDGKEIWLR